MVCPQMLWLTVRLWRKAQLYYDLGLFEHGALAGAVPPKVDNTSVEPGWEIDDDFKQTCLYNVPPNRVWGNHARCIPDVARLAITSWEEVALCCGMSLPCEARTCCVRIAKCATKVFRRVGSVAGVDCVFGIPMDSGGVFRWSDVPVATIWGH